QQRVGDSWYLGTADAIYQNLYTLDMDRPDETLILAGDHIYKMNYYSMIDYHREQNADLTVGVVEADKPKSKHLGVIEVDEKGKVIGFQEKPANPRTIPAKPAKIFGSMGIYVFRNPILEQELVEDAKNSKSSHDFGKDIIPQMLKKGMKIVAYNFRGEDNQESYWRDIGTIDAYYEANMDLIQVNPVFNLYDREWPLRTYQEQFPPVKTVHSGEKEEGRMGLVLDSIVSEGCVISGGRVQRSILSPNVRINSFSEVYDSILMEGVNLGRYAKIKRAIIDKDVSIPQGMVIGYDLKEDKKKFFVSDSGIVVVAKGTEIK
ncbi:MAG: sugar phosphate nucleotidyltransferase, partial [Candidatus Omnitrophota bacterium]|nr:sugar phosphate nucleotidyltransferase [Candidatus Omnitrophota bacterium]